MARASEVKLFKVQSQQALLRGKLEGMSVDSLGTLRLAPKPERVTNFGEPFVLSAAPHPDGWVVGTGNSGKVLLVGRDGKVKELFTTAEPEIFAVWSDAKGTVYAGSSPSGKVYRYADGKSVVWFDPKQTYIWQVLGTKDGALLVATGTQGKLFRVTPAEAGATAGQGALLWDAGDTHVRSLALLPGGDLLVGTAGEGRIVRLEIGTGATPKVNARTLYDAVEPEVVALAAAPDGGAWAAAVASEASAAPLGGAAAPPAKDQGKQGSASGDQAAGGSGASGTSDTGDAEVTVDVSAGGAGQPVGSRPPGFGGPRSEILKIDPMGGVTTVARLQEETVYSLLADGGRLWIGTGLEGKLFSLHGTDLVLEGDVEERQVMVLLPDPGRLAFATTNAAAFYRTALAAEGARTGAYTSPVLDAQQIAKFGSFRWLGEAPAGTSLRFSFRSGISAEPDATWSPWSAPREVTTEARELPLASVPSGRYVQWRVEAKTTRDGASPQVAGAEISYLQTNLAPRITQLDAMDPGQILVAFNFNPSGQAYEPAHPNREGIFTTLEDAPEGGDDRLKTLWKQGYRTLRWKAEDPNSDTLTYALEFRPEHVMGGTDGDTPDSAWMSMAKDLKESYYSFDENALPDGIYRFRLVATDGSAEHPAEGLEDVKVSEPVVVDHTPPRLVGVRRDGDRVLVDVEDAGNPLRDATYSVGAAAWQPATPTDGLLDGRRETLTVVAPKASKLVILRVMDAAFNGITFDLSAEAAK
jgi:hypothetical protein